MMIKVVRGNPTPEELAAALAVVQARAAAVPDAPAATAGRDAWSDPSASPGTGCRRRGRRAGPVPTGPRELVLS